MKLTWVEIRKRSAVVRKGWDFARQVPRAGIRVLARPDQYRSHPPLIANSFPKSGTHQLLQLLEAFPGAAHWGSFLASTPSLTMRLRSTAAHVRRIRAMVPGECMGAHIFFSESSAAAMAEMNVAHFFIYRDLRDVVVSEAFYLRDMNRWHRLHSHYSRVMRTDEERLMFAIVGMRDSSAIDYPDIGARMRRYMPWIERNDVFALKYERLNSSERAAQISEMVAFYTARLDHAIDQNRIVRRALASLDPSRSHTFRSGGTGNWRQLFSKRHLETFERVAGDLNRALGYAD